MTYIFPDYPLIPKFLLFLLIYVELNQSAALPQLDPLLYTPLLPPSNSNPSLFCNYTIRFLLCHFLSHSIEKRAERLSTLFPGILYHWLLHFSVKQGLADMGPEELDQRSVEEGIDHRADPDDHKKIILSRQTEYDSDHHAGHIA